MHTLTRKASISIYKSKIITYNNHIRQRPMCECVWVRERERKRERKKERFEPE